ncbi:MAG: hypothetical protein LBS00_05950, partial [Synergistaceae bacterium]|nr:hypothetical protein [Synergistaceae bacterium]
MPVIVERSFIAERIEVEDVGSKGTRERPSEKVQRRQLHLWNRNFGTSWRIVPFHSLFDYGVTATMPAPLTIGGALRR